MPVKRIGLLILWIRSEGRAEGITCFIPYVVLRRKSEGSLHFNTTPMIISISVFSVFIFHLILIVYRSLLLQSYIFMIHILYMTCTIMPWKQISQHPYHFPISADGTIRTLNLRVTFSPTLSSPYQIPWFLTI